MVSILADNRDIERSIEKNLRLAQQAGATFSPALVLRASGGELSAAAKGTGGEHLMRLAPAALVTAGRFTLGVEGDDIVIRAAEAEAAERLRMEAMLELYNLAGKMRAHRAASAWLLAAARPELAPAILGGRDGPAIRGFCQRVVSGDTQSLPLDTFMKSRIINYSFGGMPPSAALMPVGDFINHALKALPFLFLRPEEGGGVVIPRTQAQEGGECFVQYGFYDAFDTWLNYGFADEGAYFVRSVPLDIRLADAGTIKVSALLQPARHGKLPGRLEGLRFWLPNAKRNDAGALDAAFLLIPGAQAPHALRRVLAVLIGGLRPGPAPDALVRHAEQQVIDANAAWYAGFRKALEGLRPNDGGAMPALEGGLRLCDMQLARLRDYAARSAMQLSA